MAAYIITDIEVTDPERYQEYRALSTQAVAAYGGRFLVRGGKHETLEGEWEPGRVVVIEFPSVDAAREWWSSAEYETAKAVRREAATGKFLLVEGV
jgi:uncharacterized protein (DUF1330 family)